MKKLKICNVLILILIHVNYSYGQQLEENPIDTTNIVSIDQLICKSRYYGDSIVVRWAPENSNSWRKANLFGYLVYRADFDGSTDSLDYKLISDTIKPLNLTAWKSYFDKNPKAKYSAIAAQNIYKDPGEKINLSINTIKLKQDLLNNRHGFTLFAADVDKIAAQQSGLRFVDKNVTPNKFYIYKIEHLIPEDIGKMSNGMSTIKTDTPYKIPIIKLEKMEAENSITLLWDRKTFSKEFTGYWIEKSEDGIIYKRLNESLYIQAYDEEKIFYNPTYTFTDSVGPNYVSHHYRVKGVTMFGNNSEWSDPIKAQGVDKKPPCPAENIRGEFLKDGNVKLDWDWTCVDTDIQQFNVLYSYDLDVGFYKMTPNGLSSNVRSFTHIKPNQFLDHYYQIESIDSTGNSSFSASYRVFYKDTIPPKKPTGLSAIADTNGVVTLTWDINDEFDLMGYKVFFSNDKDHEFALITGHVVEDTLYQDTITLKTFTRYAYYKIMAVDQSFNYSEHSDVIKVVRADIIPPSSPIINNYSVNDKNIYIGWARSHSSDLERHELYRRQIESEWEIIATFYDNKNSYIDSLIIPNTTYDYKVVAVDSSGLYSDVVRPIRLTSQQAKLSMVQNFEVTYNEKSKQAELTWEYANVDDVKFVIYKSKGEEGYNVLRVNQSNSLEAFDRNIARGNNYKYTLKVMHNDGRKSKFSDIVSLINDK